MTALYLYDDVTASLIPGAAKFVAYYVDGIFKNLAAIQKQCPDAKLVSIAVKASDDADVLDVEPGDATIAEIFGWLKRQLARGVHIPVIYTSVSNVDAMMKTMTANGFRHGIDFLIWSAHYTNQPHLCGPSTCRLTKTPCDWTQFTDKANSKSLDESLMNEFPFAPAAKAGLGVVTVTTLDASYRGVTAKWSAVPNAQKYDVQLIENGTQAGREEVTALEASFPVKPQAKYSLRVAALPGGPWSAEKVFTTPAAPAPSPAPVGVTVAEAEKDITELGEYVKEHQS